MAEQAPAPHLAPWPLRWPEDRRFRFWLVASLTAVVTMGIWLALQPISAPPTPEPEVETTPPVRLNLVKPRPAVAPASGKRPLPRPRAARPSPPMPSTKATPPTPTKRTREQAADRGVLALADELRDLGAPAAGAIAHSRARRIHAPRLGQGGERLARTASQRAAEAQAARVLSGRHDPRLAERQVSRVAALEDDPDVGREAAPQGRPGRTQEEIQLVFERHKAAFDRLYNRALRNNPGIAGRITFEFAIAPSGRVSRARILHSDLAAPELERRLLIKLKTLNFGAKDVETTVVTYWIDFLG